MTTAEYNQLVDQYADRVYRFVLKNIRDRDMANDIIQDSFLKTWEKHQNIEADKAKTYLFTTAYHTMIDNIRKQSRLSEIDETQLNGYFAENSYSDLKEVLDEAVQKLPDIQRSVILLRDYEGYSYKEIGDIINLTESQVKVYIYRGRQFLKNYIGSLETVI